MLSFSCRVSLLSLVIPAISLPHYFRVMIYIVMPPVWTAWTFSLLLKVSKLPSQPPQLPDLRLQIIRRDQAETVVKPESAASSRGSGREGKGREGKG